MLPILGGIAVGWIVAIGLSSWRRLGGVAGASVMGLMVAFYLAVQHLPSSGDSFCSVNETFNCDLVNRSRWSELGGIPISLLGAGFYAATLVSALLGLRDPARYSRAAHLAAVGGLLSVGYSAFLAWASMQVGAWCLMCISLYGVNLIILVSGLLAVKDSGVSLGAGLGDLVGGRDGSLTPAVGAGAVVFMVGMVGYNQLKSGIEAPAVDAEGKLDLAALFEEVGGTVELDGTEPILGDPGAPFTVVEYADFECPHCAKLAPELTEVVKKNPRIRILFKNYPLSGDCNPQIDGPGHANACGAAYAGECARQQGKFWEMDEVMFKNQEYLKPDDILFMAEQIKLDKETFQACLKDPRTHAAVKADAEAGSKAGLRGTPTMFLKGLDGEKWVRVKGMSDELLLLVNAKETGTPLPPTPPVSSGEH
jgi:protein-disulfide isomerase